MKTYSPRPGTPGRGVGGEGVEPKKPITPHPRPLSPGYRGEGREKPRTRKMWAILRWPRSLPRIAAQAETQAVPRCETLCESSPKLTARSPIKRAGTS